MSSPTADVSVRIAWADDADAIAAIQVRAWATSYAGLVPAEALPADADVAPRRGGASLGRPDGRPEPGRWSRSSATGSSASRSPARPPTPTATRWPTAS